MRVHRILGWVLGLALLGGAIFVPSVASAATTGNISVTAENLGELSLTLDDDALDFGNVSPDGDSIHTKIIDAAVGAYLCQLTPTFTVRSNSFWTVSAVGQVLNSGNSGHSNMDESNLGIQPDCSNDDNAAAIPFFDQAPQGINVLIGQSPTNGASRTAGVWLLSKWTNTPGTFEGQITLTVREG